MNKTEGKNCTAAGGRQKTGSRLGAVLMAAGIMALLSGLPASASSSDKISSVKLTVRDHLRLGTELSDEDLEITTGADRYEVTGWELDNEGFAWSLEDTPVVLVTLETDGDSYFSISPEDVKIKGDPAAVYKTKRENSQTLVITLKLTPMSQRVGPIEYAYLRGTTASWAAAEQAESYELYLYRDGKAVGSRRTATGTTYEFGASMTKAGTYSYRVRALGAEGMKDGPWTESEELYKDAGIAQGTQTDMVEAQGQWIRDETGWWWRNPGGSWPASEWLIINGKWYFFKESGYMAESEWIWWNGAWYFMGPEGDMWTNRQTPDGHTVNADGAMIE